MVICLRLHRLLFSWKEKMPCVHTLSGCFGRYFYLQCVIVQFEWLLLFCFDFQSFAPKCQRQIGRETQKVNPKGRNKDINRKNIISGHKDDQKYFIQLIWRWFMISVNTNLQKRYNAPQISRNSCFFCLHSQNQYMWKTEWKRELNWLWADRYCIIRTLFFELKVIFMAGISIFYCSSSTIEFVWNKWADFVFEDIFQPVKRYCYGIFFYVSVFHINSSY